jgi:hypothetical protein
MQALQKTDALLSHAPTQNFGDAFARATETILADERSHVQPVEVRLSWLNRLAAFPLGQFLVENKGLNGYWTDYLIRPNHYVHASALSKDEYDLLYKIPIVLATRERYNIFKELIQLNLQDKIRIASLPCGYMSDIATLDYAKVSDVLITGMDLDSAALDGAHQNFSDHDLTAYLSLRQVDAWEFDDLNAYHLMVSNGLTIYEPNRERVVNFYTRCYAALKDDGVMVGSFLTPPPSLNKESPWKLELIDEEALKLQGLIFDQVVRPNFTNFMTCDEVANVLGEAGFKEFEIIPDSKFMFPTFVARK